MVNTWQVLGKKYGAVTLAVSLARGSTCHENTKVKNKYVAAKEDLIKWKYRASKRKAEFWHLNKSMEKNFR